MMCVTLEALDHVSPWCLFLASACSARSSLIPSCCETSCLCHCVNIALLLHPRVFAFFHLCASQHQLRTPLLNSHDSPSEFGIGSQQDYIQGKMKLAIVFIYSDLVARILIKSKLRCMCERSILSDPIIVVYEPVGWIRPNRAQVLNACFVQN